MTIPVLTQGAIYVDDVEDSRACHVFALDAPEGSAWLESATSFRFQPSNGGKPYTVRKESGIYWYGCRKIAGKVRKKYIGKSSEVTMDKLEEIAEALEVPPVPRVAQVAEVAQGVAEVTQVADKVAQDRLTILELEVANLRKALEALQEVLPGKSEAGDSEELPKVDSEVAEGLQNGLSNLKTENEKLKQELVDARTDYAALLESTNCTIATRDKKITELRSQLDRETSDREEVEAQLADREKQIEELRSQLEAEKTQYKELDEEFWDMEEVRKELRGQLADRDAEIENLRSQLEQERADREEVEAELADLAQLKKQNKEHAHELHLEENSMKLEKVRWQQELSNARAELADAKVTILNQGNKIRELERGYSFKPSPAESRLRLEIGELQSQLFDLKQKSAAASKDLPEAADLLNQLKAKRKKSKTDLADLEAILEILES